MHKEFGKGFVDTASTWCKEIYDNAESVAILTASSIGFAVLTNMATKRVPLPKWVDRRILQLVIGAGITASLASVAVYREKQRGGCDACGRSRAA